MNYFRIYVGSDGESHFEDIEVSLSPRVGRPGELSAELATRHIVFRRSPPGEYIDWHPAPRRQFVITVSGRAEITASDGEVRKVGPGTIMLAEDVVGKGHISRTLDDAERLSIFVALDHDGDKQE